MYKAIIKPLLFLFSPEKAHQIAISMLNWVHFVPGIGWLLRKWFLLNSPQLKTEFCGLHFPNPVGLAAGFDKDAKAIDSLASLGFGFIEIGTLTPKAQDGNEKPRLFRLPSDNALINRMGFNNEGLESAIIRLKRKKSTIIIGGNIGKNKLTPNENAIEDYTIGLNLLYKYVDYFVVNISSPNTPGLRELQEKEPLRLLLSALKKEMSKKNKAKPILLKIAPDLNDSQLDDIVDIAKLTGLDGIVATNTTLSRELLSTPKKQVEAIGGGGLSGSPLKEGSNRIIKYIRSAMGPDFPIMGVGGIMSPADAVEKLEAGANVLQIYSGFIYNGPSFVRNINRAILKEIKQ